MYLIITFEPQGLEEKQIAKKWRGPNLKKVGPLSLQYKFYYIIAEKMVGYSRDVRGAIKVEGVM